MVKTHLTPTPAGSSVRDKIMMKPSAKSQEAATASLKAQYVHDGVVDVEAIRARAAKDASRLWTGKHFVHKSEQDMADSFAREMIARVSA